MKRVAFLFLIILIITTTFLITDLLSYNKKTVTEIKRLEKMIELKNEINMEYSYLFEQTKTENINEQLIAKQAILKKQEKTIEDLQNEIIELNEENNNIEIELETREEEINEKLKEQERKLEQATTYRIDKEITYSQFPEYPTGCETIALYILLKYYDIDVTPDELIENLKKGQMPYEIGDTMYGGNPELEFIGDPTDDFSYGVFNTPIAELASKYKENVQNKEGLELEEILEIVSENRPVIVWSTIDNASSSISSEWIYRKTGETIYWKENEHAVVVIGYSNKSVIVSDPYTGEIEKYNREKFKENYNYLGKRAVYY